MGCWEGGHHNNHYNYDLCGLSLHCRIKSSFLCVFQTCPSLNCNANLELWYRNLSLAIWYRMDWQVLSYARRRCMAVKRTSMPMYSYMWQQQNMRYNRYP